MKSVIPIFAAPYGGGSFRPPRNINLQVKMRRTIQLFSAAAALFAAASCSRGYKTLSPEEFLSAFSSDTLVQLVDVRTPEEWGEWHIYGAENIDVKNDSFEDVALEKLSKERPVAVYCRGGVRSVSAAEKLSSLGFKDILNLDGGITAWREAGLPVSDQWDYIVFDGEDAPDFTAEILSEAIAYPEGYTGGDASAPTLTLSDLKGKVVMLQFTASWCSVCRKEMPHIETDIWQRHKYNPDFVLLGIDRDEPWEKMKDFIQTTGITYPLAFDPDCLIYDKYATHDSGITRNVLIGRDGKIVYRTRLYDEEQFSALVSKIDELLESQQ